MKIRVYFFVSILVLFLLFATGCRTSPSISELADVYYNLGNAYSELGRSADARAAYRRAFVLEPDLIKAAYSLGKVDIEAGKYDEGIDIFSTLLKKDKGNAVVKEALAWGYYKKGDKKKSLEWYKDIISSDAYNKNALHNICVLLTSEDNYTAAYPYLKQLDEFVPGDFFTEKQLGIAESKLGLSSGAVWFEKAEKEKPGDKDILNLLAEAYVTDKNYSKALETYDLLLTKGKSPEILFDKAFVLLTKVEDYDRGLKVLREALSGGFNNEKKLKKLRDYPDLLYRDRIMKVLDEYKTTQH